MATLSAFGVPQDAGPGGADHPILMPKLAYRFRIGMYGFGNNQSYLEHTFVSQVVSVSRPNLTHDEVVVDVYNSRIHLAGKHTWDPLTLVLRDDINGNVDRFVASQLQKQLNHAAQSAAASGADYKFAMKIEQLDGGNQGTQTSLDTWTLAGCFITNVQYGENNYADSAVTQITLTIRYDNADHVVTGNKLLSESVVGNSTNANVGLATGGGGVQ